MPKEEIEKKAAWMKGKAWLLDGKIYSVLDFRVANNDVYLSTKTVMLVYSHEDFLKVRETAEDLGAAEPFKVPEFAGVATGRELTVGRSQTFDKLKEGVDIVGMLKESIEKVKEDKGYIRQAVAINDTVRTILEIAKTEIALNKLKGK